MASFHSPFCATEMPNSTCSLASDRVSPYPTPESAVSSKAAVNIRSRIGISQLYPIMKRGRVPFYHTILMRPGTGLFRDWSRPMDPDDIRPLPLGDARSPGVLASIPDPPPILWTRGHPESLRGPMVAI